MHAGLDEQANPCFDLSGLLQAGAEARVPFSAAGGVKLVTIDDAQKSGADVGGAIYGAEDPVWAAKEPAPPSPNRRPT